MTIDTSELRRRAEEMLGVPRKASRFSMGRGIVLVSIQIGTPRR